MTTGHCRLLQQKDPRKVRLEYGKKIWNEVFDHNPRIARMEEVGDFQIYQPRPNGLRPYIKVKTDHEWTWREYKPPVGEIYLQTDEVLFGLKHRPEVVLEPNIKKKASPNKEWPFQHWHQLSILLQRRGIRPVQLGPYGSRRLQGVELIETPNFRRACAVLKQAKAAVLSEGGMVHAAAVMGVRSVVIMGGYIGPSVIGYEQNTNLFVHHDRWPLGCGRRVACKHCENAMKSITAEQVLEEVLKIL